MMHPWVQVHFKVMEPETGMIAIDRGEMWDVVRSAMARIN